METNNEVEVQVRKVRRCVEQIETQTLSIDAKLSALLWIVGTVGAAIIAAVVKFVAGG